MVGYYPEEETPVATQSDAVREYVSNVGRESPHLAWIISQYDTWERNPFYSRKIGEAFPPHPEADDHEDDFIGPPQFFGPQNPPF
ncbi:MAG TPA: hypothetical protein VK629_05655 [Steroidobacteraceae bacterium]|nr:hypothetical protein [Steroidobacteraceae bacterium]